MVTEYEFSIKSLSELIKQILDIQKDAVIAVTGETGSGKSTLALAIAKGCDANYNMQTQMVFSRDDLIKQITELPPKSAIVVDEAIMVAYRREWFRESQRELIKILNVCRSRSLILIMVIPDFWSLDKDILVRIRLRIHIVRRGLAILIRPDKNPFTPDIWHRKENYVFTRYNWDVKPNFKRIIGWAGLIHFGPMAKYEEEEYIPLKERKTRERFEMEREDIIHGISKREKLWKDRCMKLVSLIISKGIPRMEIAKSLNMEISAVYNLYSLENKKPSDDKSFVDDKTSDDKSFVDDKTSDDKSFVDDKTPSSTTEIQ